MILTLLQKRKKVCWMSMQILASKLPDIMGTYRRLSHTALSCILSCVHTSEQDIWCWWSWLTGTDFLYWVTKGWVIKWPVKLRTFFLRFLTFFSKTKKHDFLRCLSGRPRFLEHWTLSGEKRIDHQSGEQLAEYGLLDKESFSLLCAWWFYKKLT